VPDPGSGTLDSRPPSVAGAGAPELEELEELEEDEDVELAQARARPKRGA
jgi:hypothetical protein